MFKKNLILAVVLVLLLVVGKSIVGHSQSSKAERVEIPANESYAICKMLLRQAELNAQGRVQYQGDVLEASGYGPAQGHYVKIDGSKISAVDCADPA